MEEWLKWKKTLHKKNFAIKSSLCFCSYHISTFIFSKKKGGIFPLWLWTETQERDASSSKPDSRAFCNSWHVDQWSKRCPCLPSSVTRFNGSLLETPRFWKLGGMRSVYTKFAGLWTWLFKRKCWHEGHVCTNTNVDPLPSSNGAFTAISVPSGCMPRYTAPKPPSPIRFDLGFSAFQFVPIAPHPVHVDEQTSII